MNNLALLLATSSDPKVRDPKEAVAVAQKLVAAETDSPTCLDTLATAYFEAGQPGNAAETRQPRAWIAGKRSSRHFCAPPSSLN